MNSKFNESVKVFCYICRQPCTFHNNALPMDKGDGCCCEKCVKLYLLGGFTDIKDIQSRRFYDVVECK